jgi:formylglycine-generating enzyme required for sulfatase activity
MSAPPFELTPRLQIRRHTIEVPCFREWLNQQINIEMMQIPAGEFEMGSLPKELERNENEGPVHSVKVDSFFMGKYPITQAQWRIVASFPKINLELNPDPADFKEDDRPVEQINPTFRRSTLRIE